MLLPPTCFMLGPVIAHLREFSGSLEELLDLLQKYSWTDWGKINNYSLLDLMDWSSRKFPMKRVLIKIV